MNGTQHPTWSPDGSKIAFNGHREGQLGHAIYVVEAGGGTATRITADTLHSTWPAWSRVTLSTNRPPSAINLSNSSVAENSPSGTTVGKLSTTDPDTSNTHTYTLVSGTGSTDNAAFTISGVILESATWLDYETKNSYSIRVRTTDAGGASFEQAFTITVTDVAENRPPTVNAGPDVSGGEGTAITLSGTGQDPDAGASLTYTWSYTAPASVDAGANCALAPTNAASTTITCTDDGVYKATLTVSDGTASHSDTADVTVTNVAPTITITAPTEGQLFAINTAVALSADIADVGTNDTLSCDANWDNGTSTNNIAASPGKCTASKTYTAAGVYTIGVTGKDDDGSSIQKTVMIVVYDPSGGFVTGGGWIVSPKGAYTADATLEGKATFGFVSKYQKGATVPTGETEFHFQAGTFKFSSTSYEWLVIAGAKAQYKGTGTVNGQAGYDFLLTATDGQVAGGGSVDKFRLKITKAGAGVVYDNVVGDPTDIDAANPQAIGGGSIVIQSK